MGEIKEGDLKENRNKSKNTDSGVVKSMISKHLHKERVVILRCGHADELIANKSRGWYRNIELTGNMNEVGWSHFIFHPKYSNVVDIYEGGFFHTRGVYRSEPTSCMNNNIPYFSAISRQATVERIMEYAGERFDIDEFIAKDVTTASSTTKSTIEALPIVEPIYNNSKQHAPVYMGERPAFRK